MSIRYAASNSLLSNPVVPHAINHRLNGSDPLTLSANQIGSGTFSDSRMSSNVGLVDRLLSSRHQNGSAHVDVIDRNMIVFNAISLTSGQMIMTLFTPLVSLTVSQISMGSASVAASGLTLARMGLYTFDETTATLVARTASDTTLFTALRTVYTRSFSTTGGYPSTYVLQAGSRYGVAVICVGTTMPQIFGPSLPSEIGALSPRISFVRNSQSDLPTTNTTFTNVNNTTWARLS